MIVFSDFIVIITSQLCTTPRYLDCYTVFDGLFALNRGCRVPYLRRSSARWTRQFCTFYPVHHSRAAFLSVCGKNILKIRYSKRWRDNCFTTSQECGKQWIVWRLQFHAPTALLLAAVKELTFRNNLPLTRLITVSSVQPNSWILEKHWWRKIIKHNWMFY